MATYINNDGLEVRFGSSIGDRGQKVGVTTGAGKRREFVIEVDLAELGAGGTGFTADLNNDGTNDGFNPSNGSIPAGYRIVNVNPVVLETPAGGTSYALGTYRENGTVVDVDGLWTDAGAAGTQVGTAVASATAPWFIAAKATGTYTAGRVKFVVEVLTV